jgi:hypothetical protein
LDGSCIGCFIECVRPRNCMAFEESAVKRMARSFPGSVQLTGMLVPRA